VFLVPPLVLTFSLALHSAAEGPTKNAFAEVSMSSTSTNAVSWVDVVGGKVAIEDHGGDGALVLCVPGLGDLRSEYRFVAPALVAQGFHVVTMDLRGHGDSSVGFTTYAASASAHDVVAVLRHLQAKGATVIGTSYGAAAVTAAAALAPDAVDHVVVIGPFVRDTPVDFGTKLLMGALFSGPWRVAAWTSYFDSLFPTQKPADHAAYLAALKANLAAPGRFDATRAMLDVGRADTAPLLARVKAPVLVVMGKRDPDFTDPAAEATLVASLFLATEATVALIDDAGHYPHAERPAATLEAMLGFLKTKAP
jgi:pimeloyl-ACP methyl ester carboxylesterase